MAMAKPSPDKRLVYLHCRSIFTGANAQLRNLKPVRKLLQDRKKSIKALTYEYPLEAICDVAKDLLKEGIFGDERRARLQFPELFEPSEARITAREASEAEAARSEAEAIEESVALSEEDEGVRKIQKKHAEEPIEGAGKVNEQEISVQKNRVHDNNNQEMPSTIIDRKGLDPSTVPVPSLYPIYLPYKTQHRILGTIQSLLEECCYEFGGKWLPNLISAKQWECPESVELNEWAHKLLKNIKSIPASALGQVQGKGFNQILCATPKIRHTAVHRLRTTATGVLNMIDTASALARMLDDTPRMLQIEKIREALNASIEEISQNQNFLESKLSGERVAIAKRRAELDNLENLAIRDMVDSDAENRRSVGLALHNIVGQLEKDSKDSVHDSGYDILAETEGDSGLEGHPSSSKMNVVTEDITDLARTNGGLVETLTPTSPRSSSPPFFPQTDAAPSPMEGLYLYRDASAAPCDDPPSLLPQPWSVADGIFQAKPTAFKEALHNDEPVPIDSPAPCREREPVICEEAVVPEDLMSYEEVVACEKSIVCEEAVPYEDIGTCERAIPYSSYEQDILSAKPVSCEIATPCAEAMPNDAPVPYEERISTPPPAGKTFLKGNLGPSQNRVRSFVRFFSQ
ncbi:hypothetical protein MMC24_005181 [Lignoscripta atroalba]|nr:hypothetical protein [Lignoscripta atroalba]